MYINALLKALGKRIINKIKVYHEFIVCVCVCVANENQNIYPVQGVPY